MVTAGAAAPPTEAPAPPTGAASPPADAPAPTPAGQANYTVPAPVAMPVAYAAQAQSGPTGKATAALVLGILSLCLLLTCCITYDVPSLVCGILAVVFGLVTKRDIRAGVMPSSASGAATAGVVCGIIGIVFSMIFLGLWLLANAFFVSLLSSFPGATPPGP